MLWLVFLLLTKHFIVDFPMQGPYQYKNKGTLGHPGGILHAGLHAIATAIILYWFAPAALAAALAIADGVVHYFVDWAKWNVNARWKLKPDNSQHYWWLLGFDQWLHHLTYIAIVFAVYS